MAIPKWISFGANQAAAHPVTVAEQAPIVSAADAKLFGLENFGNTCYANSVLQALYFCGPFRELLIQYPDPSVPELLPHPPTPPVPAPAPLQHSNSRKKPSRKDSVSESSAVTNGVPAIPIPPSPPTLMSALRSLFLHISRNPADKGTVAPRAFIDKLKELNELFRGPMHQDAHEFLNFLLNRIMEDMEDDGRKADSGTNGATVSGEDLSTSIATLSTQPAASTSTAQIMAYHSTIVHRLFEGVLTSETRCLTCETVSSRDESFLDLSIDIEQNSSVTACLRQFSASEMLCLKNKFFCDSCCELQEAEKRMKIKKLPNVLALHLKRFKYQEDVNKYIKLAYRVAFPLELRLFNTVDDADNPDRLYELFAIVVHIGTGPHHGHYVTIIKARGAWMLFDDDTVTTIKESEIPKYFGDSNSGSAYVLYYQAVDLDLAALGLKPLSVPPDTSTATDIGSTPGKPLSLATAEASDPGHVPVLPPGLSKDGHVEDLEYSDKSDSPMPSSTPSLPSHTPNHQQQSLLVQIPGSDSHPAAPSSPTQHNHSLGNLFYTLGRKPSRIRTGGVANPDRRSTTDVTALPSPSTARARRPRTTEAAVSHHTHEEIPSVPPSPIPSSNYVFPNGAAAAAKDKDKERHPEKKSSTWFRRISSRQDSMPLPMSPILPKLGRRGSEAAISDSSSPASPLVSLPPFASGSTTEPSPSSMALHKKSSPDLSRSKRDKRSSASSTTKRPSTAGATMTSSSKGFGSRPSSGIAVPPPLPPMPASPATPATNGQADPTKGKERSSKPAAEPPSPSPSRLRPSTSTPASSDRNSSPTNTSHSRVDQRRASETAAATPRPSQSESRQSHSNTLHSRPLPPPPQQPLPTSRSDPIPNPQSHSEPSTFSSSRSQPSQADGHAYSPALGFSTSYSAGGASVADTPVVSPSHSSSSNGSGNAAAANWKRATRKLSFTAPMLGFGRKERERREKERDGPPSAFGR